MRGHYRSNNNGTRDAYYKIRIPQNKVDTFVNYLDGDTRICGF